MAIGDGFVGTLRAYPELALFLALVLGCETLRLLAEPFARGISLGRITRNLGKRHVDAAVAALAHADRPVAETDLAFVGLGSALGGIVGALSYSLGAVVTVPYAIGSTSLTLSGMVIVLLMA